jgi:hypothetical protein
MRRVTMLFVAFILVSAFSTFAILGLLARDRELPVRRLATIEVVGTAQPRRKLRIRWTVMPDRACAATKQEFIVDTGSMRWILPQRVSMLPEPVGVIDTFITQMELSLDVPPGPARLRVLFAYVCTPRRSCGTC